jgi:hypothetical protein
MKHRTRRAGQRKRAGWLESIASAAAASAAAVAVVPAHSVASAAVVSWNQSAGGSWSGLNWTGGVAANAPAAEDTAAFNLAGAYTVNLNVSPTVASVQFGGSNVAFANSSVGATFTNAGPLTVSAGGFPAGAESPQHFSVADGDFGAPPRSRTQAERGDADRRGGGP